MGDPRCFVRLGALLVPAGSISVKRDEGEDVGCAEEEGETLGGGASLGSAGGGGTPYIVLAHRTEPVKLRPAEAAGAK